MNFLLVRLGQMWQENKTLGLAAAIFALGTVASFSMGIILARLLGSPSDYGQFAFFSSVAKFGHLFICFGLPVAMMREYGRLEGKGEHSLIRPMLTSGRQLLTLNCLLVGVVSVGAVYALALEERMLWIAAILWAIIGSWQVHAGTLARSMKQPHLAALTQQLARPLGVILFSSLIYLFIPLTPLLALGSIIFSLVIINIFVFGRLNPRIPAPKNNLIARFDKRHLLILAIPLMISDGFAVLMSNLDMLMLKPIAGDSSAGIYAVALHLVILVRLPFMAADLVAAPFFASCYGAGDMHKLQQGARKYIMFIAPLSLVMAAALYFMTPFIPLVYGDGFDIESNLILILLISVLFDVLCGSSGFLLAMTGHERVYSGFVVFAALLNTCANIFLIPLYGTYGAAFATLSSILLLNMSSIIYMRRKLGVDTSLIGLFFPPKLKSLT